jgi:hypothetical protein
LQRLVVEPGVVAAESLDVAHQLVEVLLGRSDIAGLHQIALLKNSPDATPTGLV